MKNIEQLLHQIRETPETVMFSCVIEVIDANYVYTPASFSNGPLDGPETDHVINSAGQNEGSCKIFSFAALHDLDSDQTLNCFGDYYRQDVLQHPADINHANIRIFMKYGWEHLCFEHSALKARKVSN
jgi:hypothetical protein